MAGVSINADLVKMDTCKKFQHRYMLGNKNAKVN